MRLLALETGGEYCSVALWQDGAIIQQQRHTPQQQHQHLLPLLDALLAEAGCSLAMLDALAFGRGPGAFTGVRIATSVIQALALAHDLPVVPVSSLAALAHGAYRCHGESAVIAALDARMNQVYWASYRALAPGLLAGVSPETVCNPDTVYLPDTGAWAGVGNGWQAYPERLATRLAAAHLSLGAVWPLRWPEGWDVAQLAATGLAQGTMQAVVAAEALPVYLRDNVVRG